MGLESPTHISDLVAANPVGATDPKSEGDDHIRNMKSVLKTDFPDVNAPTAAYIVSATAPTAPVAGTRWHDTTLDVLKIRDKANTAWITQPGSVVTSNSVDINAGTIDGATIGGTTPGAGSFTNLDATNMDSTIIGATTPAAGTFTTLSATTVTFLASGTVMCFFQAAAPTSWTQVVTQNNKALRVVSGAGGGTGGTVAFTTAFASQAVTGTTDGTAITEAQMPAHVHYPRENTGTLSTSPSYVQVTTAKQAPTGNIGTSTSSTGGGAAHDHTFTGTAINLAVQYIDMILCSKD